MPAARCLLLLTLALVASSYINFGDAVTGSCGERHPCSRRDGLFDTKNFESGAVARVSSDGSGDRISPVLPSTIEYISINDNALYPTAREGLRQTPVGAAERIRSKRVPELSRSSEISTAAAPLIQPTTFPTTEPSSEPSAEPTEDSSATPSCEPSPPPSAEPSVEPSAEPSAEPLLTLFPTVNPSVEPSSSPSHEPTTEPSIEPGTSGCPIRQPSHVPSIAPSPSPSVEPSTEPSSEPSSEPTVEGGSARPIRQPTRQPSPAPSDEPSVEPSPEPSAEPSFTSSPTGVPSWLIRSQTYSVTQTAFGLNATQFTSRVIAVYLSTSADFLDVPVSYLRLLGFKQLTLGSTVAALTPNVLQEVSSLVATYAIVYPSGAIVPTAAQIISLLSGTSAAGSLSTVFVNRLVASAGPNPSLVAVYRAVSLGPPSILELSLTPTWAPAVDLRSSSPSAAPSLAPAPLLLSVALSDTGASMTIHFDSATDLAGIVSTVWTCSQLLVFAGSDLSTCSWISSSSVKAVFPVSQPGLPLPGDPVTLLGGLLRRGCGVASCPPRLYSTAQSVSLLAAAHPIKPSAHISTPSAVGLCDNIGLDATLSGGSGGRAWLSVVWTVSASVLNMSTAALDDYLAANGQDISSPITIPRSLFEQGSYVFSLTLENFLSQFSTGSATVTISSDPNQPLLMLSGPSAVTIFPYSPLQLRVQGSVASCSTSQSLVYSWEVFAGSSQLQLSSQSRDPQTFALPPYSLSGSVNYTVTATATASTGSSASVSAKVAVLSGQVFAVLAGGSPVTNPIDQTLQIDASSSYDGDAPTGSQPVLLYTWTCILVGSGASCDFALDISSVLSVAAFSMTLGNIYEFTVTVSSSDGRSDTASVTVYPGSIQSARAVVLGSSFSRVNADSTLRLKGQCVSPVATLSYWNISTSGLQLSLSNISTTPTVKVFTASQLLSGVSFPLKIRANALVPGSVYTFTFSCFPVGVSTTTAFAQITVAVNGPPVTGQLLVTPSTGTALVTVFQVTASGWSGSSAADLPLSFAFSFQVSTGSTPLSLSSTSLNSFVSSALPAGPEYAGFYIQILANVYTTFGVGAALVSRVQVTPPPPSLSLTTYLDTGISSSLSSSNTNAALTTINNVVSYLGQSNCAQAPDCMSLQRLQCGLATLPNTWRQCISGYSGAAGSSNIRCVLSSSSSARSKSCTINADCLYGLCSQRTCVVPVKSCPGATSGAPCSGHGICQFVDRYGRPASTCLVSQTSCSAQCSCSAGFGGFDCSTTAADAAVVDLYRSTMCAALAQVIRISDFSPQLVDTLGNTLLQIFDPNTIPSMKTIQDCLDTLGNVTTIAGGGNIASEDSANNLIQIISNFVTSVAMTEFQSDDSQLARQKSLSILSTDVISSQAGLGENVNDALTSLLQGVLLFMTDGDDPVSLVAPNLQVEVRRDLLSDLVNATLGTSPTIQLPASGLSACPAYSSGYAQLSVLQWTVNPYINSSSIVSPLLRWSTISLSSAPNSTSSTALFGSTAFLLHFNFSSPQNFTYTTDVFENRTIPACERREGSMYTSCNCEVVSYSAFDVVFECPDVREICPSLTFSGRRLGAATYFDDTNTKEFGTISYAIQSEIVTVLSTNPLEVDLKAVSAVLSFVSILVLLFFVGLVFFVRWDDIDRKFIIYISRLPKKRNRSKDSMSELADLRHRLNYAFHTGGITEKDLDEDDVEIDRRSEWYQYGTKWKVPKFLKSHKNILTTGSVMVRFAQAVLRFHPFICFFIGRSMVRTRSLRFISLFKSLLISLFTSTLIFGIYYPSNNNCANHLSQGACLRDSSNLVPDESLCVWDSDAQFCSLRPPPRTPGFIISVFLITSLISFPIDLSLIAVIALICEKRPAIEILGLNSFYFLGSSVLRQSSEYEKDLMMTTFESYDLSEELDARPTRAEREESAITYVLRVLHDYTTRDNSVSCLTDKPTRVQMASVMSAVGIVERGGDLELSWWNWLMYGSMRACVSRYVQAAREECYVILHNLDMFAEDEDDLKDSYLMQSFVMEQFSIIPKFALSRQFFQYSRSSPMLIHPFIWLLGWTYVIGAMLFFLIWVLLWGAQNDGISLDAWGLNFALETLYACFFTSSMRIFLVNIFAIELMRPRLINIYSRSYDLVEALMQRKARYRTESTKLVQVFSPSCIAAGYRKLGPSVITARLLRSINDQDLRQFNQDAEKRYRSYSVVDKDSKNFKVVPASGEVFEM